MNFAYELKKWRKQAGLSIYMLSKLSGVPKSTIFNYERGSMPTLEKADKLLKILKVSIKLGEEANCERTDAKGNLPDGNGGRLT